MLKVLIRSSLLLECSYTLLEYEILSYRAPHARWIGLGQARRRAEIIQGW